MARAAVAEILEEETIEQEVNPDRMTPLYAAAILKIATELRRPQPSCSLDELLNRVLEGIAIDRQAFRGYLERNFSLIVERH
jgi:hypothetical protein